MGIVKSYLIEGANLILTEGLYWTFEANRQDSVRVWKLLNFEKSSVTPNQLDKLKNYDEDAHFEVKERYGRKELIISTYFGQSGYRIVCDEVVTETRPYNEAELTDLILNFQLQLTKESEKANKCSYHIEHLKGFLENERIRKERILEQANDSASEPAIKAKAKLDLLHQLNNILAGIEQE